jgi:outer membrane protein TolC
MSTHFPSLQTLSFSLIGLHFKGMAMLLVALALAPASAGALLDDFERAQGFDPTYALALTGNQSARLQAKLAGLSYLPEGRISSTQLDNENSSRQTISITQPILSYDRWLSLQEKDPRMASAAAQLEQNQQDLALRLFRAVSTLAEAREKLVLNGASITAINNQLLSARRLLELGQGTITEVRDAEVRMAQTQSETFTLQASLATAERQYTAIVGHKPLANSYTLSNRTQPLNLPPLQDLMDRARVRNPGIRASQQATLMAEIGTRRAYAALLPSVVATAQQSKASTGATTSGAGIALRMEIPLQAGTFFKNESAALDLKKSRQQERDTLERLDLDVERIHTQLMAVQAELSVRSAGIRAAELSLDANEQSFRGGFRTRTDVLNAIKTLFQARADYASALLRLGDNLLSLQLTSAEDLDLALRLVQDQVFSR